MSEFSKHDLASIEIVSNNIFDYSNDDAGTVQFYAEKTVRELKKYAVAQQMLILKEKFKPSESKIIDISPNAHA